MLLHEIHLEVIRAPNASKPNKDGDIIRTGSEVSVDSVCSFRSCPKEFSTGFPVILHLSRVIFFSVILDITVVFGVILDLVPVFFFNDF